MAGKAWASQPRALEPKKAEPKKTEELFFRNDAVSLCLLINRRARTMRVIDFRAGATPAKRTTVQSLAQREGVDKVYTLVERDEVQTWMKLGFAKEGTIPGFYKRSDAFVMGAAVPSSPSPKLPGTDARPRSANGHANGPIPLESETRLVAARALGSSASSASSASAPVSPAVERMERTIAAGKRASKDLGDKSLSAKITEIAETDARKAVNAAVRSRRALSEFEPFGRDVERRYFLATARGGYELYLSTESQVCFSNAFLEVLNSPRTELAKGDKNVDKNDKADTAGAAAAIGAICEKLTGEGVVSCFALAPSDDVALATAFLHAGFRRTGLLLRHLSSPSEPAQTQTRPPRVDAILWSRKLAKEPVE